MTTKDELLKLFEANKGIYYNGEQIAAKLGVSRNAIWKAVTALREKAVTALREAGYPIES